MVREGASYAIAATFRQRHPMGPLCSTTIEMGGGGGRIKPLRLAGGGAGQTSGRAVAFFLCVNYMLLQARAAVWRLAHPWPGYQTGCSRATVRGTQRLGSGRQCTMPFNNRPSHVSNPEPLWSRSHSRVQCPTGTTRVGMSPSIIAPQTLGANLGHGGIELLLRQRQPLFLEPASPLEPN